MDTWHFSAKVSKDFRLQLPPGCPGRAALGPSPTPPEARHRAACRRRPGRGRGAGLGGAEVVTQEVTEHRAEKNKRVTHSTLGGSGRVGDQKLLVWDSLGGGSQRVVFPAGVALALPAGHGTRQCLLAAASFPAVLRNCPHFPGVWGSRSSPQNIKEVLLSGKDTSCRGRGHT